MSNKSKKKGRQAKREKRSKIVFAAICAVLLAACGTCAVLFRDNISIIPFAAGAALALLGLCNALWKVIYRAILPALALVCFGVAIAGQMSYVTVDGHTYSTFAREIDMSGDGLASLEGIERCKYLSRVDIHGLGIGDVSPLEKIPGLSYVNMRGNPVSESQYADLTAALPKAEILWSVPLGQSRVDDDAEELTLTDREYVTDDMLLRQLGLLPRLKRVDAAALINLDEAVVERMERALPGVRIVWTAQAGDGAYRTDSTQLALTGAESAQELLGQLKWFYELEKLDISECELTRQDVQDVVDGLENVEVAWKFSYLNVPVSSEDTRLDMYGVAIGDAEELAAVLRLANQVTSVNLNRTGLDNEQLFGLVTDFPDLTFEYTMKLFGVEVKSTDTSVDLSKATVDDAAELARGLTYLPALTYVDLGLCRIPSKTLGAIQAEHENLEMSWVISLYGFSFRTDVASIGFNGAAISDLNKLEEALEYMPNVKYIDLSGCGQSNASIAKLRDNHPDIHVVWTVSLGKWTLRTDATAFSTLDNAYNKLRMNSATFAPLQYCTELRALDLGHQAITDISFLNYMPELRILILADNQISDLSPLRSCPKLEYAELFINQITDLSPLTSCPNLLDLNLCYNYVKDVTPISKLSKLQRLWMSGNGLSEKTRTFLRNALPKCKCDFTTDGSTGDGWRDHKRYDTLFDIFNNTKEYREWDP